MVNPSLTFFFNAWCPLKGHTCLKQQLKACVTFYWTPGTEVLTTFQDLLKRAIVEMVWKLFQIFRKTALENPRVEKISRISTVL